MTSCRSPGAFSLKNVFDCEFCGYASQALFDRLPIVDVLVLRLVFLVASVLRRFDTVKKLFDNRPLHLHCEYMKSSFPHVMFSGCGRRSSTGLSFLPHAFSRHSSPATRHCVRCGAFTLIELLVVVSIVAILAGLVLSTLGYVNRKGAASRAQSEVAALSAAIESYKLDVGSYPEPSDLYNELTAGGPVNTDKVYFEPTAGMVNTNSKTRTFQDPYGNPYNYTTNATRNIGFFDLWCVPPTAESEADWIHN